MTRRGPFSADPWKASSWEIYVTKDCRTLGWGNGTPATPPCRSDGKVGHGPEGEGLQEAGFAKLAAACFGEFEEGGGQVASLEGTGPPVGLGSSCTCVTCDRGPSTQVCTTTDLTPHTAA